VGANRQNYHYQRIRVGEWATVSSHETLANAMARYGSGKGRRRVVKVVHEVVAIDDDATPPQRVLRPEDLRPASDPPDTCRRVILRFGDDGERDFEGSYWRAEGSWYLSERSKSRRLCVHPTHWAELEPKDRA
jgi:hypothetical protein